MSFVLQGKKEKEGGRKKKYRQDEGKEAKEKVLQVKCKEAGRESYKERMERSESYIGKTGKTVEERWNYLLQKVRDRRGIENGKKKREYREK